MHLITFFEFHHLFVLFLTFRFVCRSKSIKLVYLSTWATLRLEMNHSSRRLFQSTYKINATIELSQLQQCWSFSPRVTFWIKSRPAYISQCYGFMLLSRVSNLIFRAPYQAAKHYISIAFICNRTLLTGIGSCCIRRAIDLRETTPDVLPLHTKCRAKRWIQF